MTRNAILTWLRETRPARLDTLYRRADRIRRAYVGDAVHLRALIEISTYCARKCTYCGLRAPNRQAQRYRMRAVEILACARQADRLGYGTILLQAGEDFRLTTDWVTRLIQRIKDETPLAVSLSLGERTDAELRAWREAGADRYLLRFETSDSRLFRQIHPPLHGRDLTRIEILGTLRKLGYEVGSGVMVGVPGQTYATLADDIETFRRLDLDVISVGPFIPHPATPLGVAQFPDRDSLPPDGDQTPNTEQMVHKVVALTRLACPEANIPAATALNALDRTGNREVGLRRGANVVIANLTPAIYRTLHDDSDRRGGVSEGSAASCDCLHVRIDSMGRWIGDGPGGRRRGISPPDGPAIPILELVDARR